MQLTAVLALVSVSTVLSAPALTHHKNGHTDTTNKGPSDTLQLDQTGFNNHSPIITLHNSQPRRGESEFAAEKNGGPEVKRSERVDVEDEFEVEDGGASNNMELADEEVKTVLKTFFQNLKRHPEIVEDILEREGNKLMQGRVLEEGDEEEQRAEENQSAVEESQERPLMEDDSTGDLPLDSSAFQKTSPQLMKAPKQIEKKAGPFAGQPRFIYKSPMRNAKERDELTARSMNNPDNNMGPNNIVLSDDTGSSDHVDIGNAIPVIQQTGAKEEPTDDAEALLNNLAEGGDIDMAELERAEEEYREEHPFMNTLPIFPVEPSNPEIPEVDAEEDATDAEQVVKPSKESEEDNSSEADDTVREEPQSDDKRSEPEMTSEEDSEETESDLDSDESDGKWAETQVVVNAPDMSEENREGEKGSPELPRNAYYYYYNEDEMKNGDDQLNASEEGEDEDNGAAEGQDSDEQELQKISAEAGSDEVEEEGSDEVEEEGADDTKEEIVEEETDDTDAPEVDEPEDDDVVNNIQLADDTSSLEKTDRIPEESEEEEEAEADSENDEIVDKNEADLLTLFRNSQQKTANRPIAGPPM